MILFCRFRVIVFPIKGLSHDLLHTKHEIVAITKACTVTMLTDRAISGSTDFLRSTGGPAYPSSARGWERNHVLRAQAAALISFAGWKHVRTALDGSRLGTPANETYVNLCWEAAPDTFFSQWLRR